MPKVSASGGRPRGDYAQNQASFHYAHHRKRQRLGDVISLFLAGDVMTGRGIDQVLPHPGDARLYEDYVESAHDYVALAERAHGPIAKPLAFEAIWGDALAEFETRRPHARIINLETAVTRSTMF